LKKDTPDSVLSANESVSPMAIIKKAEPLAGSGISHELSNEIFDHMSAFANYGFNKSHAAAYAAVAFQTAYLKTHHPEAFFAAAMNLDLGEVDELAAFVVELQSRDIPLWQPTINQSQPGFAPLKLRKTWKGRDYGIAYGLAAIRGVGLSVAEAIYAERQAGGAFDTLDSFLSRMGSAVPRPALKALAKAGAFDRLGVSREVALGTVQGYDAHRDAKQFSLFGMMDDAPVETARIEMTVDERLDAEFDVLGHYMSAHPLETMQEGLFDEGLYFSNYILKGARRPPRKAEMPAIVVKKDMIQTKAGDTMGILLLSDPEGTYEAVVYADTWTAIRSSLQKKGRYIFEMEINASGDERKLAVAGIRPIETAQTHGKAA
jgi:DNA polymerase III subunit alpha